MKLKNVMVTVLLIFILAVPYSAQAGDDRMLQGFLGIMKEMHKQSGADADPNSKGIMDAFGKAMDGGKADRRQGKGDRQRQGKGKGKGKGKGRQANSDKLRRRQN